MKAPKWTDHADLVAVVSEKPKEARPPIIPDEEAVNILRSGGTVFVDLGDGGPVDVMAVPKCETCRWWQPNSCMSDGSGDCLRVREWPTKADTPPGQMLRTASDFGCVQWEAKG